MRLLLFDIDGTLLTCGPQVLPIFSSSLVAVFGTTGTLTGYDFGGKTDPQIVLDLMTAAGLSRDEVLRRLPRMRDAYVSRLEAELSPEGMRVMPGVREILDELMRREDQAVGLLTGNWERGGRAKLAALDLDDYFPFGAFGDDGVARADLVPAALARAEQRFGRAFAPSETLIIGDTVYDVACAQAHGVPVLAVATGRTPESRLREAGADWTVPHLPAALDLLGLGAP